MFVGEQVNYLRPRLTNHSIKPTTNTTRIIAVQKPALKIPPITSQEDRVIAIANTNSQTVESFFIILFSTLMQKLCRR